MSESGFWSVLIIAVGLSADCFAVALSSSISRRTLPILQGLRAALFLGVFQSAMTLLGWWAGNRINEFIAPYDHWLAFALLVFVGGRMIWESLHEKEDGKKTIDITSWWLLFVLAVATSLDALAVGLSFAFLQVNIISASVTIGAVALIITLGGFLAGKKLGEIIGKRAEIVGGIILIAIGIRILVEHLFID
jgi:putative Mn2+ efflux pump MntP